MRRWRSAPIDTLPELRLADDLTALGDYATAALARQAMDRFSAWKFDAGEWLLERALAELRRYEHEPSRSAYPLFHSCALAVA
jgi:hypothetical protein